MKMMMTSTFFDIKKMKVDDSGQMFGKGRQVCASCKEAGIDFHFHRFAPKRPQMMIVMVMVVVEKIRNETL